MSTLVELPALPDHVVIEQLYLGCLSQASYLIGDATTGRGIDEILAVAAQAAVHRLMELSDETMLLPAHGAGSACGKSLSTDTVSTIGEQRRTNYAVQPMTEDAFITLVTEGQVEPPAYFGQDAALNRMERPLFGDEPPVAVLDLDEFDAAVASGAAVVDTRPIETFAQGHLAGSIDISLTGRFAEQAGFFIAMDRPVVLVGDAAGVAEATLRLDRIGFDNEVGALLDPEAAIAAHPERSDRLSR